MREMVTVRSLKDEDRKMFVLVFGALVHQTRLKAKMSQVELAKRAKVSQASISRIEAGAVPDSYTCMRLCLEGLGQSMSWAYDTVDDIAANTVAIVRSMHMKFRRISPIEAFRLPGIKQLVRFVVANGGPW